MGEANFITKMEDTTKGNGRTTRWMDMGNCTMREVNWPMREAGIRTNLTVKGRSTMIIQFFSLDLLITRISISSKITGNITREP